MKRSHEGLHNYIKSLSGAGDVAAPGLQPRLTLGPDAAIPGGLRPIPSSSQAPKKTNATIVYARTAMNSTREDIMGQVRVGDAGGVSIPIEEGQLVFTYRCEPATRLPSGQTVKSFSLGRVNHILEQDGSERNNWLPDGVCNNLDGADPNNEFKDVAIANVATQGFVRFSTLNLRTTNTDRVFVCLRFSEGRWFFELFSSHQITRGMSQVWYDTLSKVWQVGRVVDGNQSKNMCTLNVSIDPVAPEGEWPYTLVAGVKTYARLYTPEEQLKRMWSVDEDQLRLIETAAEARRLAFAPPVA